MAPATTDEMSQVSASNDTPDMPAEQIARLNFHRAMRDPTTLAMMLEYAQSEHSAENMLFYEASQQFKRRYTKFGIETLTPDEQSQMQAAAKEIVEEYLIEEAPNPITLPDAVGRPYKNGLHDITAVAPNMFDQMSRSIYKTIEHDIFMRFKKTHLAESIVHRFPRLAQSLSGSEHSSTHDSQAWGRGYVRPGVPAVPGSPPASAEIFGHDEAVAAIADMNARSI